MRNLLIGLALSLYVETAAAQSLRDALSAAYATNPTIAAERAQQRATKEARPQAVAGALPTITASGAYGRLNDASVFNGAAFGAGAGGIERDTELSPLSGQIEAEQVLFAGFRNFNAIKAASARIRAGGARLAAVEQSVLLSAATAYFDVARDLAIFKANANQADVLSRQYDEARARLNVGELTRTDVSQAEARLARARAALSGAGASLAASRAAFVEIVGDAPAELEKDPAMPETLDALEPALAAARTYAPSVIAARENAEAARRAVAIANSAFSPTLTAHAAYAYSEEQNAFLLSNEQTVIGIRARAPLFTGGLHMSRLREAKADADAARSAVDAAERRAAAETTTAFARIAASRSTIAAAQAEVDANRLALAGVRRESEVGSRTTLDVLDAEQELLNAEVALARAEHDERVAIFALLAATGTLTPESLDLSRPQ